ncbi:MAG: hypothetical protein AAF845_17875 [Bacteroidota bacterium]
MRPLHAVVDAVASEVVAVASLVPVEVPAAVGGPTEGGDLRAGALRDVADRAAVAAGCIGIGDAWTPLDASEARSRLGVHVGHDLAYPGTARRTPEACEALVDDLLGHVEDGAQWLTNATRRSGGARTWMPVAPDWTFDVAYVAVGKKGALFIAFLAED